MVTTVTRLWKGGETPSLHPSQQRPRGLCQNLPAPGEAGGRRPAGRAGCACVRVFGGVAVPMAAGAAQGSPREPRLGASRDLASFPRPSLAGCPSSAPRGGALHPHSGLWPSPCLPAGPAVPHAVSAPFTHSCPCPEGCPVLAPCPLMKPHPVPGLAPASASPDHVGWTLSRPARRACRHR